MLTITPSGGALGATIRGADLSKPLSTKEIGQVLEAIGKHGVVSFPGQKMQPTSIRDYALQFGPVQIPEGIKEPGVPEISVLSNIIVDGKNIGAVDAGMIWHKDMTYQKQIGWATVLYGIQIPHRDGKPLGATRFANCYAAYDDLPADIKTKLESAIGIHNSIMYNATVRALGSKRKPFEGDRLKNKVSLPHPMVFNHPVSGRKVLYCDPGHVEELQGVGSEQECADLLAYLKQHQLQDKYLWAHHWTEGDVLMWDNMSSLHCATLDYGADEHRLMKRCQILSDKIRDQDYMKSILAQARAA
jgi:taurine dioxygenase